MCDHGRSELARTKTVVLNHGAASSPVIVKITVLRKNTPRNGARAARQRYAISCHHSSALARSLTVLSDGLGGSVPGVGRLPRDARYNCHGTREPVPFNPRSVN